MGAQPHWTGHEGIQNWKLAKNGGKSGMMRCFIVEMEDVGPPFDGLTKGVQLTNKKTDDIQIWSWNIEHICHSNVWKHDPNLWLQLIMGSGKVALFHWAICVHDPWWTPPLRDVMWRKKQQQPQTERAAGNYVSCVHFSPLTIICPLWFPTQDSSLAISTCYSLFTHCLPMIK